MINQKEATDGEYTALFTVNMKHLQQLHAMRITCQIVTGHWKLILIQNFWFKRLTGKFERKHPKSLWQKHLLSSKNKSTNLTLYPCWLIKKQTDSKKGTHKSSLKSLLIILIFNQRPNHHVQCVTCLRQWPAWSCLLSGGVWITSSVKG